MVEFPAQLLNYLVIKINHFSFKPKPPHMCKLSSTFLRISYGEHESEEPGPCLGSVKNKFIPLLQTHERGFVVLAGCGWFFFFFSFSIATTTRSESTANSFSNWLYS